MNLNEHGAMERNEVHFQTNNLICYTPKTELRMQIYDMMKMPKNTENWGLRENESQPSLDLDLSTFFKDRWNSAGSSESLPDLPEKREAARLDSPATRSRGGGERRS